MKSCASHILASSFMYIFNCITGLKIRVGHRSFSVQKLCVIGQRSLFPVIVTDHFWFKIFDFQTMLSACGRSQFTINSLSTKFTSLYIHYLQFIMRSARAHFFLWIFYTFIRDRFSSLWSFIMPYFFLFKLAFN